MFPSFNFGGQMQPLGQFPPNQQMQPMMGMQPPGQMQPMGQPQQQMQPLGQQGQLPNYGGQQANGQLPPMGGQATPGGGMGGAPMQGGDAMQRYQQWRSMFPQYSGMGQLGGMLGFGGGMLLNHFLGRQNG